MSGEVELPLDRWCSAFPRDLAADVAVAVGAMPPGRAAVPTGSLFSPGSIDSDRHPVGLVIGGDPIVIPYRYYGDELWPADAPAELSARQRTLLGCMFTRHHSGYVRQQWAREVVQVAEPWVVPFVLQLLGEYVVEIVVDLRDGLSQLDDPRSAAAAAYRGVLLENPGFVRLTRQRVASYWNCYDRGLFHHPDRYPPHELFGRLAQVASSSIGTASPRPSGD